MGNGIKGVGCDIVSIPRISELIKQQRFLNKVYTAYEQDYIKDRFVHTAVSISHEDNYTMAFAIAE